MNDWVCVRKNFNRNNEFQITAKVYRKGVITVEVKKKGKNQNKNDIQMLNLQLKVFNC